jgi:hypothetical protein
LKTTDAKGNKKVMLPKAMSLEEEAIEVRRVEWEGCMTTARRNCMMKPA